jgi:hypothetical protein
MGRKAGPKLPKRKDRQSVRRSVDDNVCDDVWKPDVIPDRLGELSEHGCCSCPATPHLVAFFVSLLVVYASSQDLFETTFGQPNLDTNGASTPSHGTQWGAPHWSRDFRRCAQKKMLTA